MEFLNKKNIIFSIKKFWGEVINPQRDWIILLLFFIIIFFVLSIVNFQIFKKTSSKELFVDVSNEQILVKKIKDKEMEKIISTFEQRKLNLNSLKPIKTIDPAF